MNEQNTPKESGTLGNTSSSDADGKEVSADHASKGDQAEVEQTERAMRKLAEQKPETMHEVMMGMMASGPMTHPLHQKMNEEHISQVLDLAVRHDEREYNLASDEQKMRSSNRWFQISIFFGVLLAVLFVIVQFKNDTSTLITIITAIISFGGGFGSGWGLASRSGTKN